MALVLSVSTRRLVCHDLWSISSKVTILPKTKPYALRVATHFDIIHFLLPTPSILPKHGFQIHFSSQWHIRTHMSSSFPRHHWWTQSSRVGRRWGGESSEVGHRWRRRLCRGRKGCSKKGRWWQIVRRCWIGAPMMSVRAASSCGASGVPDPAALGRTKDALGAFLRASLNGWWRWPGTTIGWKQQARKIWIATCWPNINR